MTYRIAKRTMFCASHQLSHLPLDHKCARLHGHNYIVEVVLENEKLDERGFVADFAEIGALLDKVKELFDHRDLNVVFGSPQATTAENLAEYIFNLGIYFPALEGYIDYVEVSETPNTWARYYG